ncbi:unnamed protein product, partial [Mycena citricolor]
CDLPLRLVCSSWHDYTSQTLLGLFEGIILRNDSQAARFCSLVRTSPRAGIRVKSIVASHLSVTAVSSDLLSEDMQERLPNLHWLFFYDLRYTAIPRDQRLGTWTQVKKVHFDGDYVIETVDGLWDWVALFAECGSLTFVGMLCKAPIPMGVVSPSDPPRVHLRSLIFDVSSIMRPTFPAALASPNLRVDKLTLLIYDASCYTTLLHVLAPKLQELRLSRANFLDAIPLKIADGCSPELHTVTLRLVNLSAQEMTLMLSDIRVILRASPNLSRILFTLPDMATVDRVTLVAQAWGELDTLLAGTVDRVCIRPIYSDYAEVSWRPGLQNVLTTCMPQLTDLGALHFEPR